ncbi:MAG: hypothetical protein MJ252_05795 [archaeon]|nr:hypothetical protein [archaeon]
MSDQRWLVKERNYELDEVKYEVKLKPIMKDQDPLNVEIEFAQDKSKPPKRAPIKMFSNLKDPKKDQQKKPKVSMFANIKPKDPLTSTVKDPLSASASSTSSTASKPSVGLTKKDPEVILPYNAKKIDDLKHLQYSLIVNEKFNIDDDISVNWTCLKQNLKDLFCNNFNMEVKSLYSFDFSDDLQKNYKIEKGRTRMDELNRTGDYDVGTSGEFVQKMEVVKREMLQKWTKEDKVGTLKIIIQCAKMLNDVSTPMFYCHKFLLISDILDNFAKLVYERILKLTLGKNTNSQLDFGNINPETSNQLSKDVVSNWMYKCCCIRELLPRIYIDISFLKIFKFVMNDEELERKILSMAQMISGISHPLIAFYVSMYFTKIVLMLYPKTKQFMYILLNNLSKFNINEDLIKKLNYENMNVTELKKILDPCVEWIVYCISKNMVAKDFKNLMKVYDMNKNYYILKGVIIHTPSKYIFSEQYLQYLFACIDLYGNYESAFLCMLVCQKILITDNPLDNNYISIIWTKFKDCKDRNLFIDCCTLLGEIMIKYYNEDVQDKFFEEVFDIFKDFFSKNSTFDNQENQHYFSKFEVFLYSILTKIQNYSGILSGDNFLYLIENFTPEIKLNICNTIIRQITQSKEKIKDTYLGFSLLKIGKFIHDSVEIFDPPQKKKEVSEMLINFIRKIDFGVDYETYLNFLTEARACYSSFEAVTEVLVKEVHKIAINTYKMVKGKHNKKTMRFIKVCIAYCQITIPDITSLQTQLKLQLITAQIALMNNLISECDSIVRNIITGIKREVTEFFDKLEADFIVNFAKSFLGFLILVPSNPDDPFQLIYAFHNIFSDKDLYKTNLLIKTKLNIYTSLIKFLTTQLQNKLPYHIYNVDSNDEIFTGDPKFIEDANNLIDIILTDILNEISDYASKLTTMDYDEFEFMILICGTCFDIFKYNFEDTKFETNVKNRMIKLIEQYTTNLEKNPAYGTLQKAKKYKEYLENLTK